MAAAPDSEPAHSRGRPAGRSGADTATGGPAIPPVPGRRRPVTPEVVRDQVVLEELDLSPDGRHAVVVRRSVEGTTYRRALWQVGLTGRSAPRRLTVGRPGDTHPRFSPDGRRLAFLSARPVPAHPVPRPDVPPAAEPAPVAGPDGRDGPAQVWILPLDGGEPWPLTAARLGVTGFAWSPDGTRIAWWGPAEEHRLAVGRAREGEEPLARRILHGTFRWDEVGYLDHRTHLRVVAVHPATRPWRLTAGDWDVQAPAWDPDGRSLVFCAARHDDADLYPRPTAWRVAIPAGWGREPRRTDQAAGEPVEIARLAGLVDAAVPSPDGRWLALVGLDVPDAPDDAIPGLFLVAARGGTPVPLAPGLDLHVGVWVDTDLTGWTSAPRAGPWWVDDPDGPALVALVSRAGRCLPWRFRLPRVPAAHLDREPRTRVGTPAVAGGEAIRPQALVDAESACWALAAAGGRSAVLGTLADRGMELMTVEGGRLRTRTTTGSAWQRRLDTPEMTSVAIPGPGGTIETWLASPAGAGDRALPLVVDIHGGPLGGWSPTASLEVRILASAGFRVGLPNIRGSAGYGSAWIRPLMGRWGEPDAADVLAVVDYLGAAGLADPARVGLLGLSYGGFLVNWLLGAAPDRFAAGVSENGVTNQLVAWALSDSGPDYNRRAALGDPLTPDGVDLLWRQSPLRLAAAIRAPLLLLQGDADVRCPGADNLQLFVALRALGRTVEYVAYPDSWHTFSVTGRPDRRIDRHRRMLEWFRRFLG